VKAGGGEAPVLFYDGVCGLCNRLVRWVLRRDRGRRFRFAALQSRYARETLPAHGKNPADLDSLYLLIGGGTLEERVLARSRAVTRVLRELPPPWSALGAVLSVVPAPLLDLLYRFVARVRYRLFGRSDRCELPPPSERERFLPLD
jgi:predicted DCC family thiol-disulfide oxidoreductase YuxK